MRETTVGGRGFTAACALGVAFGVATMSGVAHATPLRIRLRGSTHIEARTQRTATTAGPRLVVRGNVLDDAGQPLAKERVALVIARGAAHERVAIGGTAGAAFDGCDGPPPERLEGDALAVATDDLGAFCARVAMGAGTEPWVVHLTTRGSALTDAVTTELRVDPMRRTLSLVFDPRPRVLSLDEPQTALEALARFEDEGGMISPRGSALQGLAITLASESGAELAKATTGPSGRVRWTLPTHTLGAPGRGELRLTFAGDAEVAAASAAVEVERHARVTLALARDAVGPSLPEEGVALPIAATTVAGPVSGGTVEAYVGEWLVGAAPVIAGRADLVVTFGHATGDARVRVRYGWDAPWHEAGPDLSIVVPVRSPSPWRGAAWVLGAAIVVGFLALGRLRRARSAKDAQRQAPRPRAPEAAIEVVRAARDRSAGWTGCVLDAHEGTPIEGARVALERGAFTGVEVLATTTSDAEGGFALAHEAVRDGDELAVEAPLHAALRQAVPARGELRVALVLRRRALLDRLVAWARKRGKPYDTKAEPTPAHVRRVALGEVGNAPERTVEDPRSAGGQSAPGVPVPGTAAWAEAVELAAFGGEQVDTHVETRVEALRPDAEKRR